MGLAERRAAHDFETNALPPLKKQIDEAAGFAVPMEVNWETLAKIGDSHLYAESWPKVYFEPLISALQSVGRDAMGKQAIQSSLKKVIVQNTKGAYYSDNWSSFENGTLTLDHEPTTNIHDSVGRAEGLVKVLEAGL